MKVDIYPKTFVLHANKTCMADPGMVAGTIGLYYSKISEGGHLSQDFHSLKTQAESSPIQFRLSSEESYNAPFSTHELSTVIHSCKNTSEGLDEVHYRMLKHLSPEAMKFLLSTYNRIWLEGSFPATWRVALVIPIPKPNKDYRPIALTSCLCKVLERMVNARLMWFLESRDLLSPLQYGYRQTRSTLDPLIKLESCIKTAFAKKQSVIAVFFDLEKAYDTTWKYHILQTLQSFRLDGNMGVFIQNFLSSRTFRVRIHNTISDPFLQHEGVPQGSVLSTTLFLIAINDIVTALPPKVHASLYVDDFAIYAEDSNIPALQTLIQTAITATSTWASRHGFQFSTSKSCAVTFTRRRTIPHPPLSLYGAPLRYQDSAKFLGLTFDSRLTWDAHISSLKISALRDLRLLQVLSHVAWGADRRTLLRLHLVLILSKLDYGCQVYSSASSTTLRKLDAVHHLGLRLAIGAFRSSPIKSLYVESGFPSLYQRRNLLSLRYYARLHQVQSPPVLRISEPVLQYYTSRPHLPASYPLRIRPLLSASSLSMADVILFRPALYPPWLLPQPVVCHSMFPYTKSSSSPTALRLAFLEHLTTHSSAIHVYTDGSKSSHGTGFAVLFPDRSYQYSLPFVASVLTAELHALLMAVKRAHNSSSSSFILFSDSLSALLMLRAASCRHPIVLQILEWLFRLSLRKKSITFCWVPSHVGITGNEQVDALARESVNFPCLPPRSIPVSDFFPAFSSFLNQC